MMQHSSYKVIFMKTRNDQMQVERFQLGASLIQTQRATNWAIMLNDDGMAACGFLRISITQKVQGSLWEVSRHSIKPTKKIAEQDNGFPKDWKTLLHHKVILLPD